MHKRAAVAAYCMLQSIWQIMPALPVFLYAARNQLCFTQVCELSQTSLIQCVRMLFLAACHWANPADRQGGEGTALQTHTFCVRACNISIVKRAIAPASDYREVYTDSLQAISFRTVLACLTHEFGLRLTLTAAALSGTHAQWLYGMGLRVLCVCCECDCCDVCWCWTHIELKNVQQHKLRTCSSLQSCGCPAYYCPSNLHQRNPQHRTYKVVPATFSCVQVVRGAECCCTCHAAGNATASAA